MQGWNLLFEERYLYCIYDGMIGGTILGSYDHHHASLASVF